MSGMIFPEDRLRSNFYSLMARLLAGPPDEMLLARLRRIPADASQEGRIAGAWADLREAALNADPHTETMEYDRLFHGIAGRAILPYASWYQTGLLAGPPLVKIRKDLKRLGFQRASVSAEPEDHAAALCETMAMLCQHPVYAISEQTDFFGRHIGPWIESFFSELMSTAGTGFYKATGNIGCLFFQMEKQYLDIKPEPSGQDFRARRTAPLTNG